MDVILASISIAIGITDDTEGRSAKISGLAVKKSKVLEEMITNSEIDLDKPETILNSEALTMSCPVKSIEALEKINEWCLANYDQPTRKPESNSNELILTEKDEKFLNMGSRLLVEVLLAANYFQIQDLVEIISQKVANIAKDKTVEQLRETFVLPDDLTSEEKAAIRSRFQWASFPSRSFFAESTIAQSSSLPIDFFFTTPADIKIQMINKLDLGTYVRLRETCHLVNDFCENSSRYLRIQFNQNRSYLILTNSPFDSEGRLIHDETQRVRLLFGLSRLLQETRLIVIPESTADPNTFSAAISGFHFDTLRFENRLRPDVATTAAFERSKQLFIEDNFLRPSKLEIHQMPAKFVDDLAGSWKLKQLRVEECQNMTSIYDTLVFQKVPEVELLLNLQTEDLPLMRILRDKSSVTLELIDSTVQELFPRLLPKLFDVIQKWNKGQLPKMKRFTVTCSSRVFDWEFRNPLSDLENAHYLGYYPIFFSFVKNFSQMSEWWLYRMEGGRWGRIKLWWEERYPSPVAILTLEDITTADGSYSRDALCDIFRETFWQEKLTHPVDLSVLYEKLCDVHHSEIADTIEEHYNYIRTTMDIVKWSQARTHQERLNFSFNLVD